MVDEQQELRRVIWTEVFSFPQIFKSFRMAIHPTKLLLALASVILVILVGWLLDGLWRMAGRTNQPGDVYGYYISSRTKYCQVLDDRREGRADSVANLRRSASREKYSLETLQDRYRLARAEVDESKIDARPSGAPDLLREFQKAQRAWQESDEGKGALTASTQPARDLQERAEEDWEDVWDEYSDDVEDTLDLIDDLIGNAKESASGALKGVKDEDREVAKAHYRLDVAAMDRARWETRRILLDEPKQKIVGRGPFCTLVDYENECFGQAIRAVWKGRLFGGFDRLMDLAPDPVWTDKPLSRELRDQQSLPIESLAEGGSDPQGLGLFAWAYLMVWGLLWLLGTHSIYALIFLLAALAIWAVFGGAVTRVAALHAAREEKIPFGQAIRFSLSKFFSFLFAPLIPIAIILVFGFLLGLGGLIGSLPVGDIIMGLLFCTAIVLGLIIAFLTLGLLTGMPLMYPTIAVEGSDSFDAISRSFTYVFARPWRYGLYTIVSAVYGAVCYTFVRFFIFLILAGTHFFLAHGLFSTGLSRAGAPQLANGADKSDLLWTQPTFTDMVVRPNWDAMNWHESISSFLVHIWVYLLGGLLVAFVLSFLVSSQTVTYYLLRRKVDATDLDDVYIEEMEETEAQAGQPPAPAAEPPKPAEGETPPPT